MGDDDKRQQDGTSEVRAGKIHSNDDDEPKPEIKPTGHKDKDQDDDD